MFDIENMFEIERNVKIPGKGASEFISVMQKMEVYNEPQNSDS